MGDVQVTAERDWQKSFLYSEEFEISLLDEHESNPGSFLVLTEQVPYSFIWV